MKKINFKNTLWITAALMAFMILSTDLMAQRGQRNFDRPGQGRGPMQGQDWEPGQRMIEMLDLSDEQAEQLKALRIAHMEQMLPIKNQMQEYRAQLQTLRTAKNADMKAINNLIDDMAALRAKQMKSREAHHQEVRALLTDEQRVQFDTFKAKRKGMGRGHGKGMRGNGPRMGR